MALELSITTKDTVTHSEAYVKFVGLNNFDDLNKTCSLRFNVYHDVVARDGNNPAQPVWSFDLVVPKVKYQLDQNGMTTEIDVFDAYFADTILDDAGKSIYTQAYEYLKTQIIDGIDFSVAVDV